MRLGPRLRRGCLRTLLPLLPAVLLLFGARRGARRIRFVSVWVVWPPPAAAVLLSVTPSAPSTAPAVSLLGRLWVTTFPISRASLFRPQANGLSRSGSRTLPGMPTPPPPPR